MRRLITVMFALLLIAGSAAAQMKKVSGVVISAEDNEPIIGASVLAKGTTNGTITAFDGRFEFNVEENVKTLTVSYIGMNQLEQAVGQNLRIVMHSSSEELDEVVVVAYGTQSSKSLTSSVASVRGDALKDVPSVSFDQMLQGRASGVSITSPSGGVGQPPVVNIRGVSTVTSGSQPLYVVDGMPIN